MYHTKFASTIGRYYLCLFITLVGNNPCTPYDMCVKYFAGLDADIVHWEQSYFCGGKGLWLEQFIRQASFIPAQPVIVFSDSHTGHWYGMLSISV